MKISFGEHNLIKFLALEISIPAIKYYIVQGTPGLYVYNGLANIIISIFLIIVFLPALFICFKRNSLMTLNTLIFSIIFFLVQFIIFDNNREILMTYMPKIFGMSIACLIVSFNLYDYKGLERMITRCSYIIILFAMYEFFTHTFLGVRGSEEVSYDMSFGFFLVVPTIFIFKNYFRNKDKLDIIFVIISVVISTLMGSRGGILAIIVGLFIFLLKEIDLKKPKTFLLFLSSLITGIALLINIESILVAINNVLKIYGINSRFISYLISGRIAWDSGRDVLQEQVFELIRNNSMWGIGMLGDLRSHNIFIENLLFYGIPIGILLSIFVVFEWLKIFFVDDDEKKYIMIIFLIYAVIDSMLNLTVLGKDMFWIYLGFALSEKIKHNIFIN